MQKINSLYLANVQDLISSNDDSHSPYNDIYKKVLHTNVSLVDRTEKVVMPYKFQLYPDFKMPTDLANFNMSYTDCLTIGEFIGKVNFNKISKNSMERYSK